ncbi:MAG: sodium:proton antiporter, partial [Oscillospiraceae bacterium]|nr:sodium:proton antiporter [Oscillospiraceae bacterium]
MLAVSLVLFFSGRDLSVSVNGVLTGGLSLTLDGFRRLYAVVISFAWTVAAVFSLQYFAEHYRNRNRYYCFFLLTLGAVMGVFLASDLMTSFIFFEIASFTSFVWVIHDQTEESITAAKTYLYIAVIGGLVLFMGLLLLWRTLGTLRIDELRTAAQGLADKRPLYPAGICILVGFGAKAGIFPLHIWLPKAHPVAPAPASALLSGILTKVGIFGVIALSAGAFYGDAKWGGLLLV